MKRSKQLLINLTAAFWVVVVLFGAVSCEKEKPEKIAAVLNRQAMPGLHATKITTVISDSGITRYRIYTDQWDVFDKAKESYWEFPKGIHFERFNENLVIDANFHSNYARYYDNKRIWEFKGKVKSINMIGEMFETEHLFWDQNQEKIYSDTVVKITQLTRSVTGRGFESNQDMTRYSFRQRLKGLFLVPPDGSMNAGAANIGAVNPAAINPNPHYANPGAVNMQPHYITPGEMNSGKSKTKYPNPK